MKSVLIPLLMSFTLTLTDKTALQEFIDGNNLFTASVYKEILKTNKDNFLASPFSAELVIALTQSGAKDETAQEIRTSLRLPDDQQRLESSVTALRPVLKNDQGYAFQTANKLYVKDKFGVNDEFKKVATDVFDGHVENIDFLKKEEAAKAMNQWVEQQTNDKIHDLIDPETLTDRTRVIVINALYFKGNWSVSFPKYLTSKQDFHKNANEALQVDTMHETDYYNYHESPELNAKFLELSFQGEDASMTIVLPNEKEGLAALESQIDKIFVSPNYSREYVNVAVPKFKFETKMDFKGILKNLGVTKAFKDDEADLSGIAGEKGDLVVDEVIQKTFVDLNEEGVEAAAATYVEVGVPLSGFFPSAPPKDFVADHPFIFYIKVKDLVLFVGRVSAPTL